MTSQRNCRKIWTTAGMEKDRSINNNRAEETKNIQMENENYSLNDLFIGKIPQYKKRSLSLSTNNNLKNNLKNNKNPQRRDSIDMAKIDALDQLASDNEHTKNVIDQIKEYIIKIMKELNVIEKKMSLPLIDNELIVANNNNNNETIIKNEKSNHKQLNSKDNKKHNKNHNTQNNSNQKDLECTTDMNSDNDYDSTTLEPDNSEYQTDDRSTEDGDNESIKKCKCCHQMLPPTLNITHHKKPINHNNNNNIELKNDIKMKDNNKTMEVTPPNNKDSTGLSEFNLNEIITYNNNNDGDGDGDEDDDDMVNLLDKNAYSEWSNWSVCSTTCGSGKQLRFRKCNDKQCRAKYEVDERSCLNTRPC